VGIKKFLFDDIKDGRNSHHTLSTKPALKL